MRGGGEAGAGCQAAPASSTVARRAYARWRCRPWGLGGVQLPHPSFLVLLLLLLLVVQGPAGLGNCKGVPAGACTPRRAGCPAQRQPSRWFQRDRPHAAVAARGRCLAAQPTSNRRSHVLEEAAVWDVVLSAGGRGVGGWGRRRSVRAGGRRTRARPAGPPQAGTCTLHPLPMPPRARGHPAYHWANTRVGGQPSPCQPQVITPQICSTHIELGQEVSACTRGRAGRTSVCLPERCRHCSKCSSPRRSFGACSAGAWVGQTPPAAACPPLSPELTVDELDAQVVVPR